MTDQASNREPAEEFYFEDWLRDGLKGVRSKFKQRSGRLDTSGFRTHMRNARKEQLLAIRSLVDSAIDWLDKPERSAKREA